MIDRNDLPVSFREISYLKELPKGLKVSDRMIDAEIEIDLLDEKIVSHIIAVEFVNGCKRKYRPLTIDHDWVMAGSYIRPLPADAVDRLRSVLSDNPVTDLKYKDAINLLRSEQDTLPVTATENFFKSGQKHTETFSSLPPIPGLQAKLFKYQANGVEWMCRAIKRAGGLVLADEMGLGKTIQVIALLLSDREIGDSPRLIVCPTSLLVNWKRELDRFAPSFSAYVHHGFLRTGDFKEFLNYDIIITTYETIVNDVSLFRNFRWSWVICDEAQAIKNPFTNRRKALITVRRARTILMTGTPIENYLVDLWSLVDFAIPNLLGSSDRFQREFPETEETAHKSALRLRRLTEPIILRRVVTDVASDLPERIDIALPIALDEELHSHYRNVRQEALNEYHSAGGLVATLRLQLLCAHPWLNKPSVETDNFENADFTEESQFTLHTAKVERTVDLLKEAFRNESKVLVFSLFNKVQELLHRAGDGFKGVYWNEINGSTPQKNRQSIIDDFSGFDGAGCLVLNPKAAGTGLNITAATVVIHFTPVWNPALEAQASARAHRRGQTAPVTIYQLFYEDTVEEVMMERLEWKRKIGGVITSISVRDKEDIDKALRIEPQSNRFKT